MDVNAAGEFLHLRWCRSGETGLHQEMGDQENIMDGVQYQSGAASLFSVAARASTTVVLHDGWCMCGSQTDDPCAVHGPCACGATIDHYHCRECGGVKDVRGHWVGGSR